MTLSYRNCNVAIKFGNPMDGIANLQRGKKKC